VTLLGRQKVETFDVVFYTPWVGAILATHDCLPPGGAETQVLMLAQALVRQGLRVAIIVFGREGDLPREVAGVTLVQRARYRHPRTLAAKLAEIGRVWRSLARAPSGTIVYRTGGMELGVIAIYAWLARRRLVFTTANVVDFDYGKLEHRRLYMLSYRLGVRLASAIVVQTQEQVDLCRRTFGRRPMIIGSLASVEQRQAEVPQAFLWIGRLVWYKQPLEYIELARALPEARFWMVGVPSPLGHGSERLLAQEVANRARDVPNLELLPPRSHSDIGELMVHAVASVNTAEFEGMPNTLLEAWSRGIPALVLSHDPGGVVHAHSLGGFAAGSRERLVELAGEQWRSRFDRKDLSERCRAYVKTYHSSEAAAKQWARIVAVPPSSSLEHSTSSPEQPCAA
jgi:glycosyltransferase involved in cell wall biosynthesis